MSDHEDTGGERWRGPAAAALALLLCACGDSPPNRPDLSPRAALYQEIVDSGPKFGLPGLAVGVDRPGDEPWIGVAGFSDLVNRTALEPDDGFHLASVTKAITAVATLRRIDQGLLRFDDLLVELLDDSLTDGLPNVSQMTVRHLLEHSSGLHSFNNNRDYWRRLLGSEAYSGREWTTRDLLDFVRAGSAQGLPGTGFYYADSNYLLLGEILGQGSSNHFRENVRTEVFAPLGMTSAYFYSDYRAGTAGKVQPPVEGYLVQSEVVDSFDPHPDLPRAGATLFQATVALERSDTAAGIVANTSDMLRFARALYRPGFLSKPGLAFLREPLDSLGSDGIDEAGGALRAYATSYGRLLTAEGDGPGGVHTLLAHHVESDTIVVAFTNSFGRFDESDFLFDRVVAPIVTESR